MKRFIRCVSLMLVFALLFTVPTYAAEGRAVEASDYFTYTNAYLSKTSGTTFGICFLVTGTGTMDEIGVSYIKLEVSSDDSNWSPIAHYYPSGNSIMMDYNSAGHAGNITYTGQQNMYYRAWVEFYAEDDTGSGTKSYYTSSIKVP